MIQLPNNKKCYNLPEQVAQNLLNIQYLAEQYANIDELPSIWADYKTAFDADLHTFEDWTTTFEGWENTLATYLANMSSAAVGAIAGQNIAPANVAATGNITANSIIENMSGYSASIATITNLTIENVYCSAVKNGNKVTFVVALNLTRTDTITSATELVLFTIPQAVGEKLYPTLVGGGNFLSNKIVPAFSAHSTYVNTCSYVIKHNSTRIDFGMATAQLNNLTLNTKSYWRYEVTFLLSDDLTE